MGNCLVLQENVIKVMKTDGKILEYQAPIKVQEVLAEFPGHALSDSLPEIRQLRPDFKLLGGNMYFLVPLQKDVEKKKVRFLDQEVVGDGQRTGVVRIKLVITKKELQELLDAGGVSVQEMVSHNQNKQTSNDVDNSEGWKPELESMPEVE